MVLAALCAPFHTRAWQAQSLQSDSDLAAVVSTYAQDDANGCSAVGVSMTRYVALMTAWCGMHGSEGRQISTTQCNLLRCHAMPCHHNACNAITRTYYIMLKPYECLCHACRWRLSGVVVAAPPWQGSMLRTQASVASPAHCASSTTSTSGSASPGAMCPCQSLKPRLMDPLARARPR